MNNKYRSLLDKLATLQNNVLSGKVNCIPSPFPRFNEDFVGIEHGKNIIVTANTKIGKTQLTNFIFIYHALFYAYTHKDQIRLKIMYFPLEETEENITLRFISHLLYKYSYNAEHPEQRIRIGTKDLKSTKPDKPLNENILKLLEQDPYKSIMDFYYETVEFRTERNPTGINKAVESFCLENGKVFKKKITILDKTTGQMETLDAFDRYEPNDPDLYFIPIVDHMGLLNSESGLSLKATMDLMSAYFVKLRNRYNITTVEVVQQAADVESTENFKMKKLRPTANGLGDSKTISRDCDLMLGLFSPFRHEIPNYLGYDITKFRNHIRFMEVIINREGEQNGICPLYFDGLTNTFEELPKPTDSQIEKYYSKVKQLNLLITKIRKQNKQMKRSKIIKIWKNIL